ncbi:MAG: hypothetical protein WC027_03495 [Candidatus Paceibacterota bacterium]
MSFFSFSKKNNKKEKYSLAFTITSGSATGAIIKFTKEPGVQVIYSKKETIPNPSELKKSLSLLVSDLQKKKVVIDKAFYLFSSPWSISQTKTILVKENKAFKVTPAYLEKIIDQHTQKDFSEIGKIIEKKIVQMKMNGYIVEQATGQLTRDLEVSIFITAVPEKVLSDVEDAVAKAFIVKNIWCHSLSLPIFSMIRDFFPHKDDFININISDEMTDLSLVRDGLIVSEASFPLGRNYFIKELAKSMKVTEGIADSMIKVNAVKVNDELAALKLSVAISKSAEDWAHQISSVLSQWKEKQYVPDTVFLLASPDLSSFVSAKLKGQDLKFFLIDRKQIKSDDVIFKIGLMFLDKMYKI